MMCLSLGSTRYRPCDDSYSGGVPENTGREKRWGAGLVNREVKPPQSESVDPVSGVHCWLRAAWGWAWRPWLSHTHREQRREEAPGLQQQGALPAPVIASQAPHPAAAQSHSY